MLTPSTLIVLATVVINMTGVGLFWPILPMLVQELGGGTVSQTAALYGAISVVFALMQFIFAPMMGALSDRVDRRIVLALVSAGSVVIALMAFATHGTLGLAALILIFALWNGFNETIYSVSSALANDRADPSDYVMLSSTQMIAWSLAAFIVPATATAILAFMPIQFFMPMAAGISATFLLFVLYRMRQRRDVVAEDKETFQTVTAQVAYPGDYSNPDAYEDEDAGTSEGLIN